MSQNSEDIRVKLGLRPVINASGTMTFLGASIIVPEAIEAMAQLMPQFVEMSDLHALASQTIARLTGAQAGFVTASCAAGLTLTVGAAMCGFDLAAIERLPDTTGLKDEVVMQMGHMVHYGAPVEQGVRLSGARVVPVGQATSAHGYQLEGAINERTAAALYVVSHHAVGYGQIPLETFCEIAHARGVPVIVDAASEYDLRGFLAAGADIVIYSAHKFLGGPTGGIVAGRKDLVRATYLQNRGIGRGMKTGKESIIGTIAALQAWEKRDHAAVRAREQKALDCWLAALEGRPGIHAFAEADPTHNPLDRLRVQVDPREARISAWDLASQLAAGPQPVIVRDHEAEHGYFYLDPCNLHPGQEHIVAARLAEELEKALASNTALVTPFAEHLKRKEAGALGWLA